MNVDTTISTTIMVLCLVLAIPTTLVLRKIPAAEVTPVEQELILFSSSPVALSEAKQQPVFSGLECPVKAAIKPVVMTPGKPGLITPGMPALAPTVAIPAVTPLKKAQQGTLSGLPTVSMIYTEGDTAMAIIGGQILHEGSTFGSGQVVRIEKTRVQIRRAGKNIWLNVE